MRDMYGMVMVIGMLTSGKSVEPVVKNGLV